ncbi:MAG TPA: tetratricopeptide repeat protein [Chlorobaculum sp.]|nr:tetratricopeptide repeat protein [Chlorobaculum sp.]
MGNDAEAEANFRHAIANLEKKFGPDHPNAKTYRSNFNDLLEAMKKS